MKRLTKTGWTSALLSISLMAGAPRGEAQTVPCSSALERSGARQEGARAGRLVSQGLAAARCDSLVPQAPRPAYLTPVVDSTFGSVVERITNDAGLPTSPAGSARRSGLDRTSRAPISRCSTGASRR